MKRVFTADNIAEAGLMRSYLEQHDIPSMLRNEHTSAVIGDLPFVDNNPEIWVDDLSCDRALGLIKQIQQPSSAFQRDWDCHNCHEDNPGNFELCWQCGSANTPLAS